jgi:hypothetical protein
MKPVLRLIAFLLFACSAAFSQTVISSVYVSASTATTATIVWTTNTAATSLVRYGNTTALPYSNNVDTNKVTGTVNFAYGNGTYTLTWSPPSGAVGSPTVCGQPVTQTVTGTLNTSGSFSAVVADALKVTPGPGTWNVAVVGAGSIGSLTVQAPLSAVSPDVTGQLQTAAAPVGLTTVTATASTCNPSWVCSSSGSVVNPGANYAIPQYSLASGKILGPSNITVDAATGNNMLIPGTLTISALTAGNCLQAGTAGLLSTTGGPCGVGSVSGLTSAFIPLATGSAAITKSSPLSVDDVNTPTKVTDTVDLYSPQSITSLSPIADIRAYGAVSGMSDSAPNVRAAKNAIVAAGGGTIYIPKGVWNFVTADTDAGSFVNIQASHVHVVCAPGAVINSTSSLLTLFRLGQLGAGMHGLQTLTVGAGAYQANTLANSGSNTITLTTPSDASNFVVGDPMYILGGPGFESNGDGEINWVTAINAGTGVLTLAKPTSKPYTGNLSNVGTPNVVSVMPGGGQFFYDLSLEGCTANTGADFAYIGQVINAKIKNNRVVNSPTASRSMMANSFYPMAEIEIAGNSYTQGLNIAIQLADGWRDVFIHDNNWTSPFGAPVFAVSQGIIDSIISHNTFNYSVPSTYVGLAYAVGFATSYHIQLNDNIFNVNSTNSGGGYAISTGQSNGSCKDCTFENNIIRFNGSSAAGGGINNTGAPAVIVGNKVTMIGGRFGILTAASGPNFAQSIIALNRVVLSGTGSTAVGIWAAGQGADIPNQAQTLVNSNFVKFDVGALGTGMMFTAAGGGEMSNNFITGAPTAINNTNGANVGTPQMLGNTCVGVTTATNCNVLPDLGAQKLTDTLTMSVMATPVVATPTAVLSGGTLADLTQYCYQIQARNATGYSAANTEKCVTTGTSGGINSIIVSWGAVPGATSYAIYGRTTGAEAHMSPDLNLTNTSFVDTGSIAPSGAIQATMTAPKITWGGNANLYSNVSNVVKTDGTFNSVGGYQINGVAAATVVNGSTCPLGGSCSISGAGVPNVPGWLLYLGDGSDGALTCTTSIASGFENNFSSFTINAGQTCKVAARGHVIRVAGACTINGTLDASAVGVGTTSVAAAGGTGGGGGGGTSAGTAGTNTPYGGLTPTSGGTAGAVTGGNGGNGNTNPSHAVLSYAASGILGDYAWGGGGGGAGANSGGAAGNGGEFVVLVCGSLTGTGTIRADGGYGSPSTANSTGSGGGGGGGVIITRSPADTSTLTLITNGGPGGSNVVPMAQWYGGGNSGLTTTTTVSAGAITAISVGGTLTNWLAAPNCVILGGGGSGATCHFTTSGSSPTLTITGAVVDAGGSGYTASTWTTSGTGGNAGNGWKVQYTQ